MDNELYSIVFADGTTMNNLVLSGNTFISSAAVTEADFAHKLSTVTYRAADGSEEVHKNVELNVLYQNSDGKYCFVLREIPDAELANKKLQSDVEYISMMTGIDLED